MLPQRSPSTQHARGALQLCHAGAGHCRATPEEPYSSFPQRSLPWRVPHCVILEDSFTPHSRGAHHTAMRRISSPGCPGGSHCCGTTEKPFVRVPQRSLSSGCPPGPLNHAGPEEPVTATQWRSLLLCHTSEGHNHTPSKYPMITPFGGFQFLYVAEGLLHISKMEEPMIASHPMSTLPH